jgi:hypothetical protein
MPMMNVKTESAADHIVQRTANPHALTFITCNLSGQLGAIKIRRPRSYLKNNRDCGVVLVRLLLASLPADCNGRFQDRDAFF